jgi:transcription-repair coupling factor (superfamily II helicase)
LLGKNTEVEEIKRELIDRFGQLPRQLERLFAIINLRIKALQNGVQSISENEGLIQIDWLSGKRKKLAITGEDKIKIASRGIGQ